MLFKRCLPVWMLLCAGCLSDGFNERARHGITFYCHGAGNVDFAHSSIREGLEAAGYEGQVYSFIWTSSFVAPVDQVIRPWVERRAKNLARLIEEYLRLYPDGKVNLIGLSAGSAVALWAVEDLAPGYRVDNVILLSSSLSQTYNVQKALSHTDGKVYNFVWPRDPLLGRIVRRGFFTVDGEFRAESAGLRGLEFANRSDRVVNIRWAPRRRTIANFQGHTDCTRAEFIRDRVAPLILNPSQPPLSDAPELDEAPMAPADEPDPAIDEDSTPPDALPESDPVPTEPAPDDPSP